MRKIVIASHGGLAAGALDSAQMIMGSAAEILTYSLQPGGSAADFADELERTIVAQPEHEFILAADLYGASVCSSLYRLTVHPNVRLFAGFNLCMLLEMIAELDSEPMTDEDANELIDRARSGIRLVKFKPMVAQTEEDF